MYICLWEKLFKQWFKFLIKSIKALWESTVQPSRSPSFTREGLQHVQKQLPQKPETEPCREERRDKVLWEITTSWGGQVREKVCGGHLSRALKGKVECGRLGEGQCGENGQAPDTEIVKGKAEGRCRDPFEEVWMVPFIRSPEGQMKDFPREQNGGKKVDGGSWLLSWWVVLATLGTTSHWSFWARKWHNQKWISNLVIAEYLDSRTKLPELGAWLSLTSCLAVVPYLDFFLWFL